MSWIEKIEKRHVRLAELNGVIVAKQPLELNRGDAAIIAGSQAAFRAIKKRQDELAIEVADHLSLHADRLASAALHDAEDSLVMELKVKWANDPAIASAVAGIWRPIEEAVPLLRSASAHQSAFLAGQGEGVA